MSDIFCGRWATSAYARVLGPWRLAAAVAGISVTRFRGGCDSLSMECGAHALSATSPDGLGTCVLAWIRHLSAGQYSLCTSKRQASADLPNWQSISGDQSESNMGHDLFPVGAALGDEWATAGNIDSLCFIQSQHVRPPTHGPAYSGGSDENVHRWQSQGFAFNNLWSYIETYFLGHQCWFLLRA